MTEKDRLNAIASGTRELYRVSGAIKVRLDSPFGESGLQAHAQLIEQAEQALTNALAAFSDLLDAIPIEGT